MKKLFTICYIFAVVFITAALALTPNERKMVQTIKAQVEEGQRDYKDARAGWDSADRNAALADARAAETDLRLKTAQSQFDAVNKDNARMKAVYDECTSKWGLGAIFFGVRDLAKHIFIMIAVLVGLMLVIWIVSIAVPVTAPFIMIGLRAIGGVFSVAGRGVAAFFGLLHRLLQALVAKLKPAPALLALPAPPPPPRVIPPAPSLLFLVPPTPTGPTGPTA